MKKSGYYSSGEFARMAQVTLRTIRYYDKQDILKPTFVNESGARFYTDEDLVKLQQILLLKYLGFSLDDIREIMVGDTDYHFMLNSLKVQLKLINDQIEQMQLVEEAIRNTAEIIEEKHLIDWSQMLKLIHLTRIEKSLINQYKDASNISARINLHNLYSENEKGWFPWIFDQFHVKEGMKILELGCGDGTLWSSNIYKIPKDIKIVLSDVSEGMLRDSRRNIGAEDVRFIFCKFDCSQIPFQDEYFDLVIANHVLFYCKDLTQVCKEVRRVLQKSGRFICSTYGKKHMEEVGKLAQGFDNRIMLSAEKLFEIFGHENGAEILYPFFSSVVWNSYIDNLIITEAEPLISYILSCHGNQGEYIQKRYSEFCDFVKKQIKGGLYVSKDAGVFYCNK